MAAVGKLLVIAAPALVLPFLIRSAVGGGVATATEVSTIAVLYAMVIGHWLYGGLGFRQVYRMLVDTAALSGAILLILGTASGMAWAIAQSGVVQELYALSLAHFATRTAMCAAAVREQIDPDRLSFTGSFQILQTRLPECPNPSSQAVADWYDHLLTEIAEEKIPPRRNRINPRVVRQPRSKWNGKKPEHFGLPPLKKTFAEAIITPI